ncbi:sulfite exporter TauE/SafE family protein|uniref:Cytochrome c-type biogenesis protein n=1 Tax=Dendrosporobacter quercicolus TaxID=146817 RepID=A0A1G9XEI0_9FIRM|nr:cytochrome c biogenesis protein CcdA [Dendrosporobacter quercicolus]NSL49698.1 sulfite exporter TauE/SafE family protein [Dendrosporobacter quercicolus DSM 1736]SDM94703.1 cytochrome c-type biogenesis protein [Dendrosporobacter quercicolus]
MELAAAATAFIAGLLSFLSPCVLAAFPAYSAFLTTGRRPGTAVRALAWRNVLLFISGFMLVFIAVGAGAVSLGQALTEHHHLLHKTGAVFMLVTGLHFSGLITLSRFRQDCRPQLSGCAAPWSSFLLGILSTLVWTPCNLPLLIPVLFYAGSSPSLSSGVALLLIYALGFSIPFAALTLLLQSCLNKLRGIQPYLQLLPRLAGMVLVIAGLAILLGHFE